MCIFSDDYKYVSMNQRTAKGIVHGICTITTIVVAIAVYAAASHVHMPDGACLGSAAIAAVFFIAIAERVYSAWR